MKLVRLVTAVVGVVLISTLILTACQTSSSREPVAKKDHAAPDFEVTTLEGETLSLKSLRGKIVLLNFWASWCPPCIKELPHLEVLHQKYKDQGLFVLGLNVENSKKPQEIKAWVEKNGLHFSMAIAGPKILADYGIKPIPHSFFIDRKGEIKAEMKGYGPGAEKNMESKIIQLLKN